MTLDKIRSSIIKDAEKRAAEIESEASENAKKIIEDAKKEASAIEKKAEEEAKAEMKRVEMEKKSDLDNATTALMNAAEAEAVSNAMEKVMPKLSRMLSDQNLDRMLKSAIKEMEKTTDEIIVTVNKRAAASLKGYAVKHMDGEGFIIESKDGRIRLDATPAKIVEENSELIRAEISAFMFGKKHDSGRTAPKNASDRKHKAAKPSKRKAGGKR
ncbi:MAG: V-type ATP synthase subunit E [Candidatus Marsarchaeota archaeon]|nr:V-type ATP synthase subunit E [Candidatus Marsarchaeota archaeon]